MQFLNEDCCPVLQKAAGFDDTSVSFKDVSLCVLSGKFGGRICPDCA